MRKHGNLILSATATASSISEPIKKPFMSTFNPDCYPENMMELNDLHFTQCKVNKKENNHV